MVQKGVADGDALRRLERVGPLAAECERLRARDMSDKRDKRGAVVHDPFERSACPVPFQHHELGSVQSRPLSVTEDMRQGEDALLSGGQKLLHREFGRSMEVSVQYRSVRPDERRPEPVEMRLIPGRSLERGRLRFEETLRVEPAADETRRLGALKKTGAPPGVPVAAPERR